MTQRCNRSKRCIFGLAFHPFSRFHPLRSAAVLEDHGVNTSCGFYWRVQQRALSLGNSWIIWWFGMPEIMLLKGHRGVLFELYVCFLYLKPKWPGCLEWREWAHCLWRVETLRPTKNSKTFTGSRIWRCMILWKIVIFHGHRSLLEGTRKDFQKWTWI